MNYALKLILSSPVKLSLLTNFVVVKESSFKYLSFEVS